MAESNIDGSPKIFLLVFGVLGAAAGVRWYNTSSVLVDLHPKSDVEPPPPKIDPNDTLDVVVAGEVPAAIGLLFVVVAAAPRVQHVVVADAVASPIIECVAVLSPITASVAAPAVAVASAVALKSSIGSGSLNLKSGLNDLDGDDVDTLSLIHI